MALACCGPCWLDMVRGTSHAHAPRASLWLVSGFWFVSGLWAISTWGIWGRATAFDHFLLAQDLGHYPPGVQLGYGWGTGELDNINKKRRVEKETRETKRKRERREKHEKRDGRRRQQEREREREAAFYLYFCLLLSSST